MLLIRLEYLFREVSLLTEMRVWEQIPLRMGAVANWEIVPYSVFYGLQWNLTEFFLSRQKLEVAKQKVKHYEFSFLEEGMQRKQWCASPGDLPVPCSAETNIARLVGPGMASSNCKSNLLLLSFPQTIYWTATYESAVPSGTHWNQRAESPNWIELELAA